MITSEYPAIQGELRQVTVHDVAVKEATAQYPRRVSRKVDVRIETLESSTSVTFSKILTDTEFDQVPAYENLRDTAKGRNVWVYTDFFGPQKAAGTYDGVTRERTVKGAYQGNFVVVQLAPSGVQTSQTAVKAAATN